MSLKSTLSHELYHSRTRLGLTQQQVADAADISLRWYQQLEKGAFLPSFTVGVRLMGLLHIPLDALFQGPAFPLPEAECLS